MTLARGSIVVWAAAKLVDRFGRISRLWYVANPLNKKIDMAGGEWRMRPMPVVAGRVVEPGAYTNGPKL